MLKFFNKRVLLTPLNCIHLSKGHVKSQHLHSGQCMRGDSSQVLTSRSPSSEVMNITLSSPSTRNALSLSVMDTLTSIFVQLASEKATSDTRVVLIRAEGPVFSAGHDLKELSTASVETQRLIFNKCTQMMRAIRELELPVVAVVNGLAAAAGCQLVATCDLAVGNCGKAAFSTPGSSFGLFCSTPGVALARNVNRKMSADMLLTGRVVGAEEALAIGILSRVAEDEQHLEHVVHQMCEQILSKPKGVIALGKRFLYHQMQMSDEFQALQRAASVMLDNLAMTDGVEGLKAFKEKRKPKFTHRDN